MGAASNSPFLSACSKILKGNLTPWWLFGVVYSLVFLGTLGLPRAFTEGPTMAVHITMATLFVIGCGWNLYHTPSHGKRFRDAHVLVGRATMLVGFISVLTGYVFVGTGQSVIPLGARILMLTIGLIQLALQWLGVHYVRGLQYKWIKMHMTMMTYLFYMSAVLIAINWIPKMVTGQALTGAASSNWTFASMIISLIIAHTAVKHNLKHMELGFQDHAAPPQYDQPKLTRAQEAAIAATTKSPAMPRRGQTQPNAKQLQQQLNHA